MIKYTHFFEDMIKFSEPNVKKMSKKPSPDLFIRADGQPMAFLMGPTGFERQQVCGIVF